jgi:hypothetical protein
MTEEKRSAKEHAETGASTRLPYATVPTNLPGVHSMAPLPAGFDPGAASAAALREHGLLWRRPREDDPEVVKHAWRRAFARPWLPENHVVPVLEVQPGRLHGRPRRTKSRCQPPSSATNWSGCAIDDGQWVTVSASWIVPTVKKPPNKPGEGPGPDGGWDSSTWIGLDGYDNDELFQAGTMQNVDGSGNAHYSAWFEWYCPFFKTTHPDTTPANFALASDGEGNLFLAFRGEENHLDFLYSYDDGLAFVGKTTTSQTTGQGPALTLHEGAIFVAWTGTSNDRINVARVSLTECTAITLADQVTLAFVSPTGPTLASFEGSLFLAWRDVNDAIVVASSQDGGQTFPPSFTSTQKTPHAPCLAVHDGQLFVAWQSTSMDVLEVATVTVVDGVPTGIGTPVVIHTETSPLGPSIASNGSVLFLSWKGDGNDHISLLQSTDGGKSFFGKYISPEESPSSPTLALHDGQMFIGWRQENDQLDVSVVGYRNGAIQGFTSPPYIYQTKIKNLPVRPGDEIVCSVLYVDGNDAGWMAMGNLTTGHYVSLTLQPPPAASLPGASIEWIMETPLIDASTPGLASLPAFTPLVFTEAFGCGPGFAVGNPENGTPLELEDSAGTTVTKVILASDEVTIDFAG